MVSHDIGNDRTQTMMMFDRTQPNEKQLAKPVEPICQSKSARIGGAIGVYWNGEKARILWY